MVKIATNHPAHLAFSLTNRADKPAQGTVSAAAKPLKVKPDAAVTLTLSDDAIAALKSGKTV